MSAVTFEQPRLDDTQQRLLWKIARWMFPGTGNPQMQMQVQGAGGPPVGGSTPAPVVFSWAPASAVALWVDSGGPHNGNLATFQSTANLPSVVTVNFNGSTVTSITGAAGLPGLLNLSAGFCFSLASVDVHNSTSLNTVSLNGNALTSVNVLGCTALTTLNVDGNLLTSLDCTGLSALSALYFGNNQLGDLWITGCLSLTTFWGPNNPGVILHP